MKFMNSLLCIVLINGCATLSKKSTEPLFFVSFHKNVISGQKPDAAHFSQLDSLGVRTIICVDSVPPNINAAKQYDIESIHIPMHYGVQDVSKRTTLIAATQHGLERGNVYIHCHYGKHRSAAAAGISLVGLGIATNHEMRLKMEESGTSPTYLGLWESVRTQTVLDNIPDIKFHSRVMPEGMTKQMIEMNRAFERLELAKKHDWQVPESHPDVSPASDAGLIVEVLRTIHLSNELNEYPFDFETRIVNAIHHASGLEDAIIGSHGRTEVNLMFHQVEQSCTHCHDAYRGIATRSAQIPK